MQILLILIDTAKKAAKIQVMAGSTSEKGPYTSYIRWSGSSPAEQLIRRRAMSTPEDRASFDTAAWLQDFTQKSSDHTRPLSKYVLNPEFHLSAVQLPQALLSEIVIPEPWLESRAFLKETFFRVGKNIETYVRLIAPEKMEEDSADRLAVGFASKLYSQSPDAADMVLVGFAVGSYPPSEPPLFDGDLDLTTFQADRLVHLRVQLEERLKGKNHNQISDDKG